MDIIKVLSQEFAQPQDKVSATVELIDQGCTIPFIARYRKEVTGSMDDQLLRSLSERLEYLRGMDKRREEIRTQITQQEKMTPELEKELEKAETLAALEDIYRPFRPKRRTRASMAREQGLEPLAQLIAGFSMTRSQLLEKAAAYVSQEQNVETPEAALAGAMDIVAEDISDRADLRGLLRTFYEKNGTVTTKEAAQKKTQKTEVKKENVYEIYYDYTEAAAKMPGHRILAVDRGERDGFLKVSVEVDHQWAVGLICGQLIPPKTPLEFSEVFREAAADAYERLIHPSLERELRNELSDKAAQQAIHVFALNLRQLLMQPPVKGKVTLGLDPAYRTGCKIAVVDETGRVLETSVVYPTPPQSKVEDAKRVLLNLMQKYRVTAIAIGNGTASRESEQFVAEMLRESGISAAYMVVSEAGASVYSASKLAAEEFPDYDVSLRSAVSIARRLQDPLAELVKIDPKAIGVGQYQHDMPKAALDEALAGVVEDCVNAVGVDLNTASHSLLSHIAGITPSVAKNIIAYREENGAFHSRKELLKVNKLGKKAFEQCAGFLRVAESEALLDNTAVHPESYQAAEKLLETCGYDLSSPELRKKDALAGLERQAKARGYETLSESLGIGIPTLEDIIAELSKPGRDPRDQLPPPLLRTDVMEMSQLKEGMELTGTVRNVVDFGAFVDIGVHEDGLVHISQISDQFVKHPSEILRVNDIVKVKVLSVDAKKKRIALTMRGVR